MMTLHTVQDEAKVDQIANSLIRDGWVGAPLVAWDELLVTGVHRYAATQALDWSNYEIPMVELADLFAEQGLDLDALVAEIDADGTLQPYAILCELVRELPDATLAEYGIDIH